MTYSESFVEIKSYQYQGLEKKEILVQGIKTRGISQLSLSGNLSASLRDSRDKIKAVVTRFTPWGPVDKILLNLLPSDLAKFSPQLEVPMALACLILLWPQALDEDQTGRLRSFIFSGSLALSGDFSELEIVEIKTERPVANFKNLSELWAFVLCGEIPLQESPRVRRYLPREKVGAEGRAYEKFWLQIAAEARLPVLLVGPPGIGKSHLARWAQSCLSIPTPQARKEIDRIWTLAGQEEIPEIPFQNPHSRTHLSEFVGVARHEVPRPGVFSLAHGGLLVLDEFPELARDSREILRNILDEKRVVKNTKAGFCIWPANFWLILTANPCPCGYAQGNDLSRCRCLENVRQKYIARLSGPLLDRMGVKIFLRKESLQKFPELPERLPTPIDKASDFPFAAGLTPRELTLFTQMWNIYARRVVLNEASQNFFAHFLQNQKTFTQDWLVHVYA